MGCGGSKTKGAGATKKSSEGKHMPEIQNLHNFTENDVVSVKHEQGQVLLLDFWATWCPPCQKPMAHNQEMVEAHKKAGDWKNVRIIGLSIDDSLEKLKDHVVENGWESVEHYWTGRPDCKASDEWKITGVPHCVLIDTEGKIAWSGHPSSMNFEEAINKLLNKETI